MVNTGLNELVVVGEENSKMVENYLNRVIEKIKCLPPAQSEIIYCKDCAKHNIGSYEVHPDGSSTWTWKDSACPLVSWRGKAQGHEYDYQYCVYAGRKVTE